MENYFTVLDTSETSMFPQRFSNHIYYSKQVKIYLAYESVYSIKLSVHGCQSYQINGSVKKIPARRYVIVNNHQPVTCLPMAAERAVSIFFEPRLVRDVYHNLVASDDKLLSDPQVPADPEPCFFEHVYPLDDNLLSAHLLSLGSRFACKEGRRPCGFDIDTFFSLARALILSQQETFRQIRRTRAIKPSTRGELIKRMLDARAYLYDQWDTMVPVGELARQVQMSPFHFHRVFTWTFGCTPTLYQRHVRMEKAKALLIAGKNNVSEIAVIVGYDDIFSFSKAFKRTFGIAPSTFLRSGR